MLPENKVLITDDAGKCIDLLNKADAGDGAEVLNGLLCPGFINCHCHLELSHLLGHIPERTGLVDFVYSVVNDRHFDEAAILSAIEKAEDQMLQNGIVAVGDICNNSLTLSQKKKQRLRYHNFIEASGAVPEIAIPRFERAVLFYEMYKKISPTSIVPHAPYSVSAELFQLINDFPGNYLLTIHNQETEAENEFFNHKNGDLLRMYEKMNIDISFFQSTGKSSLQSWLPYFNNGQSIILVHNVSTSAGDLEFMKLQTPNPPPDSYRVQTFICLCPNANLYISNTLPDVELFVKHGCDIVVGTDSLASNHQLSILEELKTLQKKSPEISLATMLQWATINGAKALQMDNDLGSFEKGKQPGLLLISDVDELRLTAGSSVKRIV